jgi:hypothetical protein
MPVMKRKLVKQVYCVGNMPETMEGILQDRDALTVGANQVLTLVGTPLPGGELVLVGITVGTTAGIVVGIQVGTPVMALVGHITITSMIHFGEIIIGAHHIITFITHGDLIIGVTILGVTILGEDITDITIGLDGTGLIIT